MLTRIIFWFLLCGTVAAIVLHLDDPVPGQVSDPAVSMPASQPAYDSTTWVYTGGPLGGLGYDVRMDPRDRSVMYVTDAWAGAFKSTDWGQSWFPINNGLPKDKGPSGDGISIFSLTIDPNNPDRIWAGGQYNSGNVLSVAWGGEQGEPTVYAVVWDQGLYRSTNFGLNWTLVNANPYPSGVSPSPGMFLKVVAVNPVNPQYIYAGYFRGGISISRDGGLTWDYSNAGLPAEAQIMDIVLDPGRPAVAYAGSFESGVYYTTNGGETWTSLNGGLLTRSVHDLALSQDGSVLYMASEGAGVFRLGEVTYQLYIPVISRP